MNDDGPEYEEAFFETTGENILASGMGQAFVDYTIMVLKNTREWEERRNMADFMAKDLLNWHQDIHCAKAVRICPHAGMCMPGYDIKSTLDKSATYCCRSTTSIWLLATCMYVILISTFPRYVLIVMQEQTLPAQLASIAKTEQMANTFIWLHDPSTDKPMLFGGWYRKSSDNGSNDRHSSRAAYACSCGWRG
jgi:hypothetical protein